MIIPEFNFNMTQAEMVMHDQSFNFIVKVVYNLQQNSLITHGKAQQNMLLIHGNAQ